MTTVTERQGSEGEKPMIRSYREYRERYFPQSESKRESEEKEPFEYGTDLAREAVRSALGSR